MSDLAISMEFLQTTEVLSPYLPGTNIQYAWDSTSLGLLKTCPRLYQYVMIEGWGSKDESIHLRYGIEYHTTLEEFDILKASGATHDEALHEAIKNLYARTFDWVVDPDTKAGKYKNRTSILQATIDYMDKYRDDPAQTFILDDGRPAVELSGHLDRVVDFQGMLFGMDRKTTTTTLSDYYFAQYEPNNQMTLYTLASKVILKTPVKGIIIDAVQLLLEKPNAFQRSFTYRTEDQLQEWLDDLGYWLSIAESYADQGYWPQNDTACDKFGGCRFREVCSKSPGVRDAYLRSKFTQQEEGDRWNPLKAR
jgi:hypothetical protein